MLRKSLTVSDTIDNMKEKLLVVGSGGFGRVTLEHAMIKYDCSFVDDRYEVGTEICGARVIGKTDDLPELFKKYKNLIISIGSNEIRRKVYNNAKSIGFNFPNIICMSAYISPFASVGEGCVILNNVVIQNGSKVGNGVILNPGVEVHHDSEVGNFVCIYTNSVVRTYAKVGDGAKLGSSVTISNRVTINEDKIIEDGMVVSV